MYLAELNISNFRKLRDVTLHFQPGLNVLVGPNNVGKSAVVDALRALLSGHEEPYPRFNIDDLYRPENGEPQGSIDFHYVFMGLSPEDEADFISALKPADMGIMEAHIHVRYASPDNSDRFRVWRWCGDYDDVQLTSEMMENLRGVYLQPLRDASLSLRPGRNSQLSRLFRLLTDEAGRTAINNALSELDAQLSRHEPIRNARAAVTTRHDDMLGNQFAQVLDIGLSATDFQRLSARLSLSVDAFEIEQNGLGFNNLIFMAVVLSELTKNPDATFRSLIVEEPEAHLHPQLQAILLRYLSGLHAIAGEKPVQLFVTSHSPHFASNAGLDSLLCLIESAGNVEVFCPRNIQFATGKREKLERYLDVTRAELFFARRVIFVEGAAELMLIDALASHAGYDLRAHGVSLISVEGLNFDSFLPLFGEQTLKIPVALITDADPPTQTEEDVAGIAEEAPALATYPGLGDDVKLSANTAKMKNLEDGFVKVFHGVKTLEYDLALYSENREAMLTALADPHPRIAQTLRLAVEAEHDNTAQARILFCGMFERPGNNVQKGRFGQALAQVLSQRVDFTVPDYILNAVRHACQAERQ